MTDTIEEWEEEKDETKPSSNPNESNRASFVTAHLLMIPLISGPSAPQVMWILTGTCSLCVGPAMIDGNSEAGLPLLSSILSLCAYLNYTGGNSSTGSYATLAFSGLPLR